MSVLLPNTTQTPNALTDRWMAVLSGAEWKVVSYIVRRTYGFQASAVTLTAVWIAEGTLSADGSRYLDDGTGLSVRAVQSACDALAKERFLVKTPGAYANSPATYAINLAWTSAMMSAARVSKLAGRAKAVRRRPEDASPLPPEASSPDGEELDGHDIHLASAGCSHIEVTPQKLHSADFAYRRNCIADGADFAGQIPQILHSSHTGASEGLNPKPRETKGNQEEDTSQPPLGGVAVRDGSASPGESATFSRAKVLVPKWKPEAALRCWANHPRPEAPDKFAEWWDRRKVDDDQIAAIDKSLEPFMGRRVEEWEKLACKSIVPWFKDRMYLAGNAFPGIPIAKEKRQRQRDLDAWRDEKDGPARAEAAAVERRRRVSDDEAARLEEQREQSRCREAEIDKAYLALPAERRKAIDVEALAIARRDNKVLFALDPNFDKPFGGKGALTKIRRDLVVRMTSPPSPAARAEKEEVLA